MHTLHRSSESAESTTTKLPIMKKVLGAVEQYLTSVGVTTVELQEKGAEHIERFHQLIAEVMNTVSISESSLRGAGAHLLSGTREGISKLPLLSSPPKEPELAFAA